MTQQKNVSVDDLLRDHHSEVVDTARWLRAVVLAAMPDAREKVWPGWHGFGYHHPQMGYICGIFPRARTVSLFFEHGTHLPDPAKILTPSGRRGRSVVMERPGHYPADQITAVIDAAVDHRGE
ncbi:DUF1801 domain-containing protein [Nonomuraea sp. NPDC050328]|uniref:DUF1801 domain-containing protein n=1 Tax=Nonomuraea sp. NPDC050328 TaxID=3364361 RepID=UPI00378F1BBD